MARGLSPLQHEIIAVLDARRGWSRPNEILAGLGRNPTPSNRAALSRALKRLWARNLIELRQPETYNVGKSNLYRAHRR